MPYFSTLCLSASWHRACVVEYDDIIEMHKHNIFDAPTQCASHSRYKGKFSISKILFEVLGLYN